MSRTITALFDSRADAEAGGERLRQAGVDAGHVAIHDQSSHKTTGDYSTHQDRGLWASIKNAFLPDEDRHTYEEGIRRGGFLLTADVDDDKTAAAVSALEEANSVDLDQRSQQWRSDGWDYAPSTATAGMATGTTATGYEDRDRDVSTENDRSDRSSLTGVRDTDRSSDKYRSYYRSDDDLL
jgi:hypothetical protein